MNKVILVTGASSGIGLATVKKLLASGYIVYGSARKLSELESISGLHPLKMDMTNNFSLESGVRKVITEQGRIDVLFNNAGYGQYGSVEETSIADAKYQFEVNLFGLARLTQLVIPYMRKKGTGTIINMSSMGGKIYTPLGAWYHASKHALEGWSDCLRLELGLFNIDVVIIEPGGIQTKWGKVATENMKKISGSGPYKQFTNATIASFDRTYGLNGALSPPTVIADVVVKIIKSNKPKTRYVAGKYAKQLLFIRKFLGDRIFDKIISPK